MNGFSNDATSLPYDHSAASGSRNEGQTLVSGIDVVSLYAYKSLTEPWKHSLGFPLSYVLFYI